MNVENLCYGCMKEKENAEDVCPYCGFEQTVYEVKRSTRTSIVYKMPTDSKVMEVTIDYNADDKVEQLMVFY